MASSNVRILGRTYKVIRKTLDKAYGQCDNARGTITLDPDQDAHSMKDTFLHECMHGILSQQGYNHPYALEEKFVRPLATGLISFLQDNPAVARWLIEKAK